MARAVRGRSGQPAQSSLPSHHLGPLPRDLLADGDSENLHQVVSSLAQRSVSIVQGSLLAGCPTQMAPQPACPLGESQFHERGVRF